MAAKDHGMTEDEFNSLTDEERAGLEEEHEGDEGEGAEEGQGEGEESEAAGRDDGAQEPEAPAVPERVEVPLIKPEDVTSAHDRIAAIKAEADELETKFEDGDITAKEFRAGLDKLHAEEADLQWKIKKSELSAEVTEQQKMAAWYASVGEYLGEHPELKGSELKLKAFDTVVRQVTGDPANASLTNRQQLAKAHEIWARELGQSAPKAAPKQEKAAWQDGKRFTDRKVPPTLAKLPASDVNETDDGKYAHLDRLADTDPIKFEEALGKMSEAEQEAYLASN